LVRFVVVVVVGCLWLGEYACGEAFRTIKVIHTSCISTKKCTLLAFTAITFCAQHPLRRRLVLRCPLIEPEQQRNMEPHDDRLDNNHRQVGEAAALELRFAFRPDNDLSRILGPGDPDRMKLTREEYENAITIKELVEGLPDLDNLSDLMYVQYAIVCKDDTEDVINRCYALQAFKEEYKILDSYEQGCRYLDFVLKLFPRLYLSFGFDAQQDGSYMVVQDMEKFDPKAFTTPDMEDDCMRAMYYFYPMLAPDIESIRKGHVVVTECLGMGMRKDVLKYFTTFFSICCSHYPQVAHSHCFHTGTMLNVAVSILRKILPENMRGDFQVGFMSDDHLADVLLVPTVEAANERVLKKMKEVLRRRYDIEASFRLPN
jgi:hypothetical protein